MATLKTAQSWRTPSGESRRVTTELSPDVYELDGCPGVRHPASVPALLPAASRRRAAPLRRRPANGVHGAADVGPGGRPGRRPALRSGPAAGRPVFPP